MLTLQRRQEVAGLQWSELSADMTAWRLPGERAKNGRATIVPLSTAALAVLQSLPRLHGNPFVFPGSKTTPIRGFRAR